MLEEIRKIFSVENMEVLLEAMMNNPITVIKHAIAGMIVSVLLCFLVKIMRS